MLPSPRWSSSHLVLLPSGLSWLIGRARTRPRAALFSRGARGPGWLRAHRGRNQTRADEAGTRSLGKGEEEPRSERVALPGSVAQHGGWRARNTRGSQCQRRIQFAPVEPRSPLADWQRLCR